MKKILCIAFLFFIILSLSSCQEYDISKMLFIASVGIEKKEDSTYQAYFYLPLSSDVGKTETYENKGKGQFAKSSGKTIPELFHNVQAATSLNINFKHVSSIVLNEELLNKEFIIKLCDFIKYSLEIDYNCYMFATKEKLEELYDFQNPNQESVLDSLLISSNESGSSLLVAQPLHFLKFISDFYAGKSIILPFLILAETWNIDSKPVKTFHAQSAVFYYKDEVKEVINNPSSPYFTKVHSFYDKINEVPISYADYNMKLDFKDKLNLNIEFSYKVIQSDTSIQRDEVIQHVTKRIHDYINEFKDMDPLNLAYYNYAYGKSCSYETMNIHIVIHQN